MANEACLKPDVSIEAKPNVSVEMKRAYVLKSRTKNYVSSLRLEGFDIPPQFQNVAHSHYTSADKQQLIAKYKSFS